MRTQRCGGWPTTPLTSASTRRQILIYPMLDDRNTTADPHLVPFAAWSYDDNITGWNALLGPGHESAHVDAVAAPARLVDAIAFDTDVARRARADRHRVLRSL